MTKRKTEFVEAYSQAHQPYDKPQKVIVNGTLVPYPDKRRGGPRPNAGRPKGEQAPTERFTCRVRPEHLAELERLAEAAGLTPSAMGGKVIAEWLELERLGWTGKVR